MVRPIQELLAGQPSAPGEWIDSVRKCLSDTDVRNPLLDLGPFSRSGLFLPLQGMRPERAYAHLVLRGADWLPLPAAANPSDTEEPPDAAGWPEVGSVREPPARELRLPEGPDLLGPRLVAIHRHAEAVLHDTGRPWFHLALGALRWMDDTADEPFLSPLLLLPVATRLEGPGRVAIEWEGRPPTLNPALAARLAPTELPAFRDARSQDELLEWYVEVARAGGGRAPWSVSPATLLGPFNSSRLALWSDLDPAGWGDRLPARVVAKKTQDAPSIDAGRRPWEGKEVLAADKAQSRVLAAAAAGASMVVEAPPGTGSTQTAANLVAECVGRGGHALVVSRKRTSLSDLASRLGEVGLGPALLDLFSGQAHTVGVLKHLRKAPPEGLDGEIGRKAAASEVREAVGDLERAARAEGAERTGDGLSSYEVMSMGVSARETLEAAGVEPTDLPKAQAPQATDVEGVRSMLRQAEGLTESLLAVWPLDGHPWRFARITSSTPKSERRFHEALEEAAEAAVVLETVTKEADVSMGFSGPRPAEGLGDWRPVVDLAQRAPADLPRDWSVAKWRGPKAMAKVLAARAESFQKRWRRGKAVFSDPGGMAVRTLLQEARDWFARRLRRMSGEYRQWRQGVPVKEGAYAGRWRLRDIVRELENLEAAMSAQEFLESNRQEATALYGEAWRGVASDLAGLASTRDWMDEWLAMEEGPRFHRPGSKGPSAEFLKALPGRLASLFSWGPSEHRELSSIVRGLDEWEEISSTLCGYLGIVRIVSPDAGWGEAAERLSAWRGALDRLPEWSAWTEATEQAKGLVRAALDFVLERGLEPEVLSAICQYRVAAPMAAERGEGEPAVGGKKRAAAVRRFVAADTALLEANRRAAARAWWEGIPLAPRGIEEAEEDRVLQVERTKTRGHMPLSDLLDRAGTILRRTCPITLATPEAVARYLPRGQDAFDLVVIEDADALRTVDCLGSVLRGAQVVVLGDPAGLGPTSLFEVEIEEEGAYLGEAEGDREDGAEAFLERAASVWPGVRLDTDHRRLDESLAAHSSATLYGSGISCAPAARPGDVASGLRVVTVDGGAWSAEFGGANPVEAQRVAADAVDWRAANPEGTLLVVALASGQRRAVQDALDKALAGAPDELAAAARAGAIRVLAPETATGEAAEAVFVSIGYGSAEGTVDPDSFAALAAPGGSRRLAAAMAPATTLCRLYASFRPEALPLDGAKGGVGVLAAVLHYAATRELVAGPQPSRLPPFEAGVRRYLESKGHAVRSDLGSGALAVGLAVADPDDRGAFVLAVDCGAGDAADAPRDVLVSRPAALAARGWPVHSIWAPDWWSDPASTRQSLLEAVDRETRKAHGEAAGAAKEAFSGAMGVVTEARAKPKPVASGDPYGGVPTLARFEPVEPTPAPVNNVEAAGATLDRAVDLAAAILGHEGPHHEAILRRRLRECWATGPEGKGLSELYLYAVVARGVERRVLAQEGPFIRAEDAPLTLHRRVQGRDFDDLAQLPPDLVRLARDHVLEVHGDLSETRTMEEVARFFGYRALWPNVRAALERAL